MRAMLVAAFAALTCAGGAQAQSGDPYIGTWAFQTERYGDQNFGVIMSGAAIITRAGPNRYSIRLLANELIVQASDNQSRLLTARQTCTGRSDGAQLTIECQMAEPLADYQPDNFVLQQGESDQLVGGLTSAASPQATFSRIR